MAARDILEMDASFLNYAVSIGATEKTEKDGHAKRPKDIAAFEPGTDAAPIVRRCRKSTKRSAPENRLSCPRSIHKLRKNTFCLAKRDARLRQARYACTSDTKCQPVEQQRSNAQTGYPQMHSSNMRYITSRV